MKEKSRNIVETNTVDQNQAPNKHRGEYLLNTFTEDT